MYIHVRYVNTVVFCLLQEAPAEWSCPGSSRRMGTNLISTRLPPSFVNNGTTFHIPFPQDAPAELSCPWSSRRLGIITILQEAPAEWWSPGSSRRMGVYGDLPVPLKLPPTWHTSLCMSRKLQPNGHTVTGKCHTFASRSRCYCCWAIPQAQGYNIKFCNLLVSALTMWFHLFIQCTCNELWCNCNNVISFIYFDNHMSSLVILFQYKFELYFVFVLCINCCLLFTINWFYTHNFIPRYRCPSRTIIFNFDSFPHTVPLLYLYA